METATLMLVLAFHFLFGMASASSPSVIIIGAGMSGISAAKTLHDAGINDFLILEATNHVGGRVKKTNISGYTIELGANWVEGVGGAELNPIRKMADEIKLKTFYSDYSNLSANTYTQENGLYPEHVVRTELKKAEKRFDLGDKFATYLSSTNKSDISIHGFQCYVKQVPTTPLEMVLDFYLYDYEDSEPPRYTSLKYNRPLPTFANFGEDQDFVVDPRGYETVVHHVANQVLSTKGGVITDHRLKLNKVVREVKYSKRGVVVKTEDGYTYKAKFAMVSTSIGVLQSDLIKFKPNFPQWKVLAINSFDVTIFTKIFLKFPSKFWPSGPGTTWFLYAHQRRGYYPIWQHFENTYPGSNILMVLITDEESRRIEQQSDAATEAEAMEVLRKMFGNNIPNPTDIIVPRWWSDRFFRGTFGNWPIGYSLDSYEQMKAPIGPIFFTGEHTSEKYNGYLHGAYLSGIDSANHLIKCIKNGDCGAKKSKQR